MSDDAFWSAEAPTAPAAPTPVPMPHLADGTHRELRWCVQALPCGARLVTISGHLGPRYVFDQREMHQVTRASVERMVDAIVDAPVKAKRGRRT